MSESQIIIDGKTFYIVKDVDGHYWIEIQCDTCGETFSVKLQRFCSTKCYGKSLEMEKK